MPAEGRSAASDAARGDDERAIFWAVIASISVTLLVIVAFVTAFFQIQHERGVAIFFMISLGAFTISLVDFACEVRIALSEYGHYG